MHKNHDTQCVDYFESFAVDTEQVDILPHTYSPELFLLTVISTVINFVISILWLLFLMG